MSKAAQKIHATTQRFTEVEDIVDDIVLFQGGSAALIIEVTATNFALLSSEEQDSKIYSYAALLNSLSFPIQIIVRSKKLDISSYLKLLDVQAKAIQNDLLANQIRLYRDFVQELVKVNTVLDKKFYVCIPYSYMEKGVGAAATGDRKNTKSAFLEQAKTALHSKAEGIHSQVARLNLRAKTLEKEELIKLFYETYNDQSVETNQITDNLRTPVVRGEEK
ncbi:MAG: hypothetical protein COX78_01185 [Candidatus Levybacteria bacterium CG_4_10_14_0_2_um_filter_35_8]|nr:MAG: hypothetical protein COX78_01185 [Candidatus Levybacteria bacterium CG_4_10_14_0_2_um_filter_35_8]